MKKIPMRGALLILITLGLNPLFSQSNKDSSATAAFHFSKHSFQFSVKGLFLLDNFQGALISYKRHINDHLAWRVGVGLSGTFADQENDKMKWDSDKFQLEANITDHKISTMVNSQLIYYFNPVREIKFYAGAGPYASISFFGKSRTNPPVYRDSTRYQQENNFSTRYYEGGLSLVYGLEWFFKRKMSLSAEYGFRFGYQYKTSETKLISHEKTSVSDISRVEKNRYTENVWKVSASQVALVLSIYF